MDTPPLPGFAETCKQSSDSADILRTCKSCSNDLVCHDLGECKQPTPKPRSIIVRFSDVGRANRSWSKVFKQGITTADIAREAKKNGGLMSSSVDAELSDGGSIGHIIVGGFRIVGTFSITPA